MLSKYAEEYYTNWERCLPLITFAYNKSVQKRTKFSPFLLLCVREPRLPQELQLNRKKYDTLNDYVKSYILKVTTQKSETHSGDGFCFSYGEILKCLY